MRIGVCDFVNRFHKQEFDYSDATLEYVAAGCEGNVPSETPTPTPPPVTPSGGTTPMPDYRVFTTSAEPSTLRVDTIEAIDTTTQALPIQTLLANPEQYLVIAHRSGVGRVNSLQIVQVQSAADLANIGAADAFSERYNTQSVMTVGAYSVFSTDITIDINSAMQLSRSLGIVVRGTNPSNPNTGGGGAVTPNSQPREKVLLADLQRLVDLINDLAAQDIYPSDTVCKEALLNLCAHFLQLEIDSYSRYDQENADTGRRVQSRSAGTLAVTFFADNSRSSELLPGFDSTEYGKTYAALTERFLIGRVGVACR